MVVQNKIRKANQKLKFSKTQLNDLKMCADKNNGYLYYTNNFCYVNCGGIIKYEPYDFQQNILNTVHNQSSVILVCSRQLGKTETVGLYLLWYAMYHKNKDILVTANKFDQAKEIIKRIQFAYEHTPEHARAGIEEYNKSSIQFDTGSRIVARSTTADASRGLSPAIIYADEFAFVRPNIQQEFYSAMLPALSTTGGKLIVSSTPISESDKFSDIWRGATTLHDENGNELPDDSPGINGFKALIYTWKAHPKRNQDWEKTERAKMNDDAKFDREHNCLFTSRSDGLLTAQALNYYSKFTNNIQPLYKTGEVRWYKHIEYGKNYAIALDPSLGTNRDYSAIQIFQLPEMIQVAEWMSNKHPVEEQIKIVAQLSQFIDSKLTELNSRKSEIYWSFENNGIGQRVIPIVNNLNDDVIKGTLISPITKNFQLGFNTNNKNKIVLCSILKRLCEQQQIEINSKLLVKQLSNFIASGSSFAAQVGENDDLISATLIILSIIDEVSKFDDDVYNKINENSEEYIEPMPYIIVNK